VTQDIDFHRGRPIVYSVGNFVMKETDNDNQRRGWVLRLQLDRQGVQAFDTVAVDIDMSGIPTPAKDRSTPCWSRGQSDTGLCAAAR
jgi:poly-gamma-glutamate synthesis protein (capsule biosynthesis protein)